MKMKVSTVLVLVCLAVWIATASGDTCEQCTTAYHTPPPTSATGSTTAAATTTTITTTTKKARRRRAANGDCSKLNDYIKCLDSSAKGSEGCPLPQTEADEIKNCKVSNITDACLCEKTFWGAKGDCTALPALEICLNASKEKACDGTTEAKTSLSTTKTRLACGAGSNGASGLIVTFLVCAIWMFSS